MQRFYAPDFTVHEKLLASALASAHRADEIAAGLRVPNLLNALLALENEIGGFGNEELR